MLQTGYQNGVAAENKALCFDFLLDVVHFCFLLVYCLIEISCQCLRLISSVACMKHNTWRSQLQLVPYNPEIQRVTRRSPPPVQRHPTIPDPPTPKSTSIWLIPDTWILRVSSECGTTGLPNSISNSPSVYRHDTTT